MINELNENQKIIRNNGGVIEWEIKRKQKKKKIVVSD